MYNVQPCVFQVALLASVVSPSWWWAGASPADTTSASGQSGVWCLVSGFWCVVCGVWCVVSRIWYVMCGVWYVVCDVWCVVCGVWCVVCGVWCYR